MTYDEDRSASCPFKKPYGEFFCRDGVLWIHTYSEMGPPDSRMAWGDCPHCTERVAEK